MSARAIERICMGLTILWLVLSWTGGDAAPNTAVVISSVFLAAAFVIGALRS